MIRIEIRENYLEEESCAETLAARMRMREWRVVAVKE